MKQHSVLHSIFKRNDQNYFCLWGKHYNAEHCVYQGLNQN
uniref:Uncharacterized protein n=1 Tax=Anguilla anguilla TaxID=7936 RepID=A0A0E9ST36_ANGAN